MAGWHQETQSLPSRGCSLLEFNNMIFVSIQRPRARSCAKHVASRLGVLVLALMIVACGGGSEEGAQERRVPLAVTSPPLSAYDPDDLYRFFAIAFGAAPGVTYMGQLLEAANYGLSIKEIVNIFTAKPQFTNTYPATMSNQEFATKLVSNVVGTSASGQAQQEAVADIVAALALPNWTRGDVIFAIFSNLARKPANAPQWAGTARKMANQVAFARYYTETMKGDTVSLSTLRAVVASVTEASNVTEDLSALIQGFIAQAPRVASINAIAANAPLAYDVTNTFTVAGSDLDTAVTVTGDGCAGITSLPGATVQELKFSCRPNRDGNISISLASAAGLQLKSATFSVPKPLVRMTTTLGSMLIELEPAKAPVTVNNFLGYIQDGFFINTVFHRVISNFMVQGGGYTFATNYFYKAPTRAPIRLEKTSVTGLSNTAGTIAMARTSLPDSATSQFFINLEDNLFLNAQFAADGNGYAVFGTVISSSDVNSAATLSALRAVRVVSNGSEVSLPTNPPLITAITRVR